MNPVKAVVASVATIALTFSAATIALNFSLATITLTFSLQPHPRPFWESNIVFAGEENVPSGNLQSGDMSGSQSPKMGKSEGTQSGTPVIRRK
jgi:hypothetical protein